MVAGDTAASAGLSAVTDGVDWVAGSETLLAKGEVGSPGGAYTHSLSDFVQVTQRGRSSSHFTRLLRHVRLAWSVLDKMHGILGWGRRLTQCLPFALWRRMRRGTYQPVVVRRPLAREGRGFRGL